jgi:hypothetical protein
VNGECQCTPGFTGEHCEAVACVMTQQWSACGGNCGSICGTRTVPCIPGDCTAACVCKPGLSMTDDGDCVVWCPEDEPPR